uniref:ER-bound oxygenase mpaB/mpaB'/Rubber oxygenase catalytic domain-containing protein n=1 Tax=Anopheles triannulatus TaxID=58253 RepID=A0A2M4ATA7_9DIPT
MHLNNNESKKARAAVPNDQTEQNYLNVLDQGANISVDYGEIELPEWYDDAAYRRGQEVFKRNFFAMFLGKLCGLLAIITVPSILRVLVHTNQSSEPRTAYRRYLATIYHTLEWYYEDMKPNTRAWKSVTFVRKTHAGVSRHASSVDSKMIISQRDMAITQFGFIGCIIINSRMLGIQWDQKDRDAFAHFWRVIGHMMGIEERFNACTDCFETTEQRMQVIAKEILRSALLLHTEQFVHMGKALIDGLWCFNPFVEFDSFLYMTMRLVNVPGYHYFDTDTVYSADDVESGKVRHYEHFGYYARFVLFTMSYLHAFLLQISIIRWYFNAQMLFSRFLITYFPFLAFFKFGIRDSYVRILK